MDEYPFLPADIVRRKTGGPELEVVQIFDAHTTMVQDCTNPVTDEGEKVPNDELTLVRRWGIAAGS